MSRLSYMEARYMMGDTSSLFPLAYKETFRKVLKYLQRDKILSVKTTKKARLLL